MTEERTYYGANKYITVRQNDLYDALENIRRLFSPTAYNSPANRNDLTDRWIDWLTKRSQPQIPPGADVIRKALYDTAQAVADGTPAFDAAYKAVVELGIEEASVREPVENMDRQYVEYTRRLAGCTVRPREPEDTAYDLILTLPLSACEYWLKQRGWYYDGADWVWIPREYPKDFPMSARKEIDK